MKKTLIFLFLFVSILLVFNMNASAQVDGYLKLSGAYSSISGDFDGSSVLTGYKEIIVLVPDIKPGPGFGISVGVKEPYIGLAMGFSYSLSFHEATFEDQSLDIAYFHNFDLFEITYFFPRRWANSTRDVPLVQFHITSGLEVGMLKVLESWYPTETSFPLCASYTIIGMPVEPGITLNLSKNISLNINVGYRLSMASSVKVSGKPDPGPEIGGGFGGGGAFCNAALIIPLWTN